MRRIPPAQFDCGWFRLTEPEVYDFARRFDPQDFHLSHEAAKRSIFGRLTASGLHSASMLRHVVLKHAFDGVDFVISPRARKLQMHLPVYPEMDINVRFVVKATRPLEGCSGIVEVDTLSTGRNQDGDLVISMEETNLVSLDGTSLPADIRSLTLERPLPIHLFERSRRTAALDAGATTAPIFLEDAPSGARFAPATYEVSAADAAFYHRNFDASGHENHWMGVCLGVPIFASAFYSRAENVGGPGIEDIVFGQPIQAGDRLDAEMEISVNRPMNSRPGLGVCTSDCIVWNQRGLEVTRFRSTTFLRRRPS